ncbi:HIT domain-containing protein [Brevundimonas guildfordensis]|jgi:diadenosine tetraphosphate (Ap4A) HIT family hydrolase|uniref:HIT domain-containing protein n=1 Tax=Brevundimonas guildfordensis TaxID=2762241 RepID=A0ABR8R3A2_9CAUL|nr:HIT domain-containing protein [Brevundimonas guildfordensis]MBD7942256.1 HIT domain-containing protein [Brevundimonas guildfordensis]
MPSPSDFRADPAFEAASVFAADWPLCQVRLQDDARFAWLILLPRLPGAVELEDLSPEQRAVLTEEIVRAGSLVRELGALREQPVDKLNVAALGNVTAQLHIHVVGRRRDDPLWPDPVWGRPGAVPCAAAARARALSHIAAF